MSEPVNTRDLRKEIEAHRGITATREWQAWSSVHAILLGNEAELLALVDRAELSEDGPSGDALFREILRLLHNYVAAVVTLVDHTRNHMRQYEDTEVWEQYQSRLEVVRRRGVSPFMSKLRNYLLHYRVPPIGLTVHYDGQSKETTVTLFLERDKCLEWKDWPTAARAYLAEQPEQISLRVVVREYAVLIEDLYRWLYEQFTVLHGEDIAAVNALIVRMPHRTLDGSLASPVSD